jgi:tRNA-splicing ligase RtcB (3'-phosphate/5'-hydroxy nucleic acid ligase)
MECEVVAFLSESLFNASEEALWQQAAAAASYPGALGVYLMPDCHLGYGIPVGGVLVTEDTIVQAGSGYDISCGVVYMEIPGLHASDVADWSKRIRWISEVERRVATGIGSHRAPLMTHRSGSMLSEIFRFGAKPLGVSAGRCERQFIPVSADFSERRIPRAMEKAAVQLGSVGGGNHFVELQVDGADGSVWAMVHCGSRGFGWQTANHFFHEGAKLRGLSKGRREESWLRVEEPLGREYWAHHNAAANYAVANRHTIASAVQEATEQVFQRRPKVFFELSHNLVQEETVVLPDGSRTRGFVHRKGATRAFPAGHPDLEGGPWEETGHPCLVPGSMLHGAAVLFPEPGAEGSGFSVNHGSGRLMSRSRAKRELRSRHNEIDAEMESVERVLGGVAIRGVASNCRRTPLDECGHVYKDLDEVVSVLVDAGVARLERRLYPVANIKGVN